MTEVHGSVSRRQRLQFAWPSSWIRREDFDRQEWVGNPKASHDSVVRRSREQFVDLVKSVYRVLLSRGLKGCYVHFMDRETERFVRSRMGNSNL